MKHLDLFSGIGGFALAAEAVWPGIEHIFCENDAFCTQVLKKHWPEAQIFGDIRTLTADSLRGRCGEGGFFRGLEEMERGEAHNTLSSSERNTPDGGIDLLTGGFPCQPFSQAGRRKGTSDDRFLWPEMCRVISETSPEWVVAENVRGLLSIEGGMVFEQVCLDLENLGYEVQPFVIPAVAVNAPHRRDRVWIVAHKLGSRLQEPRSEQQTSGIGQPDEDSAHSKSGKSRKPSERKGRKDTGGGDSDAPDSTSKRMEGRSRSKSSKPKSFGYYSRSSREWDQNWLEVATRLCRVDDGLPKRMDRNPRLKALGNAIVPQVAIEIFKALKSTEQEIKT